MMNKKHLIILMVAILFNSCIVKSLEPFYTKETVVKNDDILGSWDDEDDGHWKIINFKDEFKKAFNKKFKTSKKISDDTKKLIDKFENSYIAEYSDAKKRKSSFIITLFKVNEITYADFISSDSGNETMNRLERLHLIQMHSIAKIKSSNNNISFSWLREKKVKNLIESGQIRIKHLKKELTETAILTDNSQNLQEFIKRYEASNIEDKWTEKESYKLSKKVDAED